jgi:hypothetical protein
VGWYYDLKSLADYATDPNTNINTEDAAAAIATAEQFIVVMTGLLK